MAEQTELFRQRYGHRPPDRLNHLPWSPTLTLLLQHTSTRHFLSDALPDGTLETLVAAGQSASSSSMLLSWSAIAIQDPTRKDAVATLAGDQDFIRQAPLFILFCADLNRMTNVAKILVQPDVAPHNLDSFLMATIDATLAAQNMAIAAEALGLGMCYVGAVRNNAQKITELLNLPSRVGLLFGMAVGKADPARRNIVKPRLPFDEVLHRETWKNEGQEDRVSGYDSTLGFFYNSQKKLNRVPWSHHIASYSAKEDLDGRERIRGVFDSQRFGFQ